MGREDSRSDCGSLCHVAIFALPVLDVFWERIGVTVPNGFAAGLGSRSRTRCLHLLPVHDARTPPKWLSIARNVLADAS